MYVGIILGPQAVPFVERFIVLCPYLRESTSYQRFHCTYKMWLRE